jgi:DNA-binding transcriptional LysR family regulator
VKLNELDLNKLHVFRILAESSSMREAGERLLRTPSAVSQSISSLESSLGLRLFSRVGIRLDLTDAGRRILAQVQAAEQGLQEALAETQAEQDLVLGQVTLGLPPGYPALSLSAGMGEMLLRNSSLQLRLKFRSHAELAEGLNEREMDVALSLQPLSRWNRRIRCLQLREEHLVLAVPPRHRQLASGEPKELPIVDYYQKPLLIEGWLKHHRRRRIRTQIRVFASNLDYVLRMVRSGVGCAVVPRHVISEDLSSGNLLEHVWDRRRPWLAGVWLNTLQPVSRLSPAARSVWEALRS